MEGSCRHRDEPSAFLKGINFLLSECLSTALYVRAGGAGFSFTKYSTRYAPSRICDRKSDIVRTLFICLFII
jgi:hypothetical protein